MQTNRISEAQYAFLRDVRDGVVLLNELIEKHRLEDKRFSRWMRGVGFRRALAQMVRESKKRRWLTLQLAGNVAAELRAEAVRTKVVPPDEFRSLLNDAGDQARREEQARRTERRAARSASKGRRLPSADEDLCHPNAKEREDELLAALAADARAGAAAEEA